MDRRFVHGKRGAGMTPEAKARQQIDLKLEQAGWVIQDMKQLNLGAAQEAAVGLSLKQSIAQRQNIQRAAFIGQLVSQGLADESASVLLERIRAEGVAREAPKRPCARSTKEAA